MGRLAILFVAAVLCLCVASAAENPQIEAANKQIHAKLYLPDAENGLHKAARFNRSGVSFSLEFQSYNFYRPWFTSEPFIDLAADPGQKHVEVHT